MVYPSSGAQAGYITETTVGGKATIYGQETYFIGVIPFFLLIEPSILIDRGNMLSLEISRLREHIRKIMAGKMIDYIPRQERMSKSTLLAVKQSLL